MQIGDRVEDVVVGILGDRVCVRWLEYTTWIKRSYLTVTS
jgi:hypothetical protein